MFERGVTYNILKNLLCFKIFSKNITQAFFAIRPQSLKHLRGDTLHICLGAIFSFMISCVHLCKHYGQKNVLKDVTHTWDANQCHGIIGRSGAGKTTLLRCLAKIEKPSSGTLAYHTKACLGVVFQSYSLLTTKTVLNNVLLPVVLNKKKTKHFEHYALDLLERVGLLEYCSAYPNQLSGGQKQRVAIARALIMKPQILLCDELTSALDQSTTRDILFLLKNLLQELNLTIIMITHDLGVVKDFADTVCLMEKGEIIESGYTSSLLTNPKTNLAKEWVNHIYGTEIPAFIQPYLRKRPSNYGIYRLHFNTLSAAKPIISSLIRALNQPINILSGRIDHIQKESLGHLMISIPYDPFIEKKVIDFLKDHDIYFEGLGYLETLDVL